METNLFGVAWLSKALLPALRRHAAATGGTARIVNVGSIGSMVGVPWEAFYHASKFGLLGLSESLQHEIWRQGIRISVVMPGGVKTPFIDKSREETIAQARALPEHMRPLYEKSLTKIAELSHQVDRFGSAPEKVAARIETLLRSRRPPFRALVGPDAHILNLLRSVLPTPAYHRLIRAAFTA
jgi:NAD(P)-dependent dehydrogenase (short-subunit alcohol dehydrogenase family)